MILDKNASRNLYVAQTKNTGRGLFAAKDFKRRDFIFAFSGGLVRRKYCSHSSKVWPRWLGIGRETWINTGRTNPGYYINHSCRPNAGLRGKREIVAMCSIKRGEEITFDYSISEEDPCWWMRCRCGSKNCRKVIGPVTSLSPRTFEKYRKFISPYFRAVWLKHRRKTH